MQENINIPDSTITTNLSFRNLVLMNMQQLTNFPYIEKDFDALTDYELLCLVVKFLNDVIANQNEQNTSITSMYNAFLELQTYFNNTKDTLVDAFNNLDDYVRNYFDNLDVQEEINNKLDKMLEDGVLEQIIEQFIQSSALWCFDNVADMKLATNLIDGSYVRTIGYYAVNDGGGATYKIRTITNDDVVDEANIIAIYNDLLVAELIYDKEVCPEQFGCYGDNTHDDTTALQLAITTAISKSKKLVGGKTYKITNSITISGDYFELDLSNSTINYDDVNSAIIITRVRDSNLHFGIINALNGNGLEFKSLDNTDFCQYINLYFKIINSDDKCIFFNPTGSWCNEIRLFDGMLSSGNYGIYADAKNRDILNNITIQNVGIEGVTTGLYLANRIYSWNLINLRYHESYTTLIETIGIVDDINFIGSGLFYIHKCKFSSTTNGLHIIAPIAESGGAVLDIECLIIKGFVYLPNVTQYKNISYLTSFDMTTDINKNDLPNTNITYFFSGPNNNELILSPIYGTAKGINEFLVKANWDTGHTYTIKKGTNIIYTGSDTSWGTYKFKWNGNTWIYEKTNYVDSPTSST